MKDRTNALAPCARGRLIVVAAAVAVASACSPPPPRSYDFFLNDSIARDGTLARCDRDPVAAQTDIECANARRAALAVQLEEERARREALERESAAKIEALRRAFEAQRAREAAEALSMAGSTSAAELDTAEGDTNAVEVIDIDADIASTAVQSVADVGAAATVDAEDEHDRAESSASDSAVPRPFKVD